jgi:DNA-binding MarR family transcriptional regulator
MSTGDRKFIPEDILRDSLLAHIAAAYFAVVKKLERKTKCSATRGFILSKLRGGPLNKNQIAKQLGFDRTVVHRAIQSLLQERLVSQHKAKVGRALLVQLTPKGEQYREVLIQKRRTADDKLRQSLSPEDRSTLLRLLKLIPDLDL